MRGVKIILMTMLPLFLGGCWDSRDPEDREYIITLGIDMTENTCIYSFVPAKTTPKESSVFSFEAGSLAEALSVADRKRSRGIDLGQMKMVVLGQSLLENKEQLNRVLEEMARSQQIMDKIMVLGTTSEAKLCLDAVVEADGETGLFLWDFYRNTAEEVAVIKSLDLDTLLTKMTEQKGAVIFPRIEIVDGGLLLGGGIAVTGGVFFSALSEEEEESYLFLTNEEAGILLEIEDEGVPVSLMILRGRASYDFEIENGQVRCRINLSVEGDIHGGRSDVGERGEHKKNLENAFSAIIKEQIENTIVLMKERGAGDIYGLESRVWRKYPNITQEMVADMKCVVEVNLNIRDTGRIR